MLTATISRFEVRPKRAGCLIEYEFSGYLTAPHGRPTTNAHDLLALCSAPGYLDSCLSPPRLTVPPGEVPALW